MAPSRFKAHKTESSASKFLLLNPVKILTSYIDYIIRYITLLVRCGVQLVLVFDGAPLRSKENTEEKRS